jgi:hypothetical protein
MSQDILDKITDLMTGLDDLKNAGIDYKAYEPDVQKEIALRLIKNNAKSIDKLKQDYADLKKKHPDIRIDFFEP